VSGGTSSNLLGNLDPLDLVTRLSNSQIDDTLQIPQWILMLQENNLGSKQKLTKIILTATEMRSRLIRIKLPTVMGHIDRLQNDYLELIRQAADEKSLIEISSTTETSLLPSVTDPLSRVLDYLSGINDTRKGHLRTHLPL
jgi:hypothetical protein